ncbi:SO2930 family diheme c-type cytochrome [uncultured Parasphingorhabdus sp.]|uniref:SO2930 family diheme c-type cytochrome n=1 Tax=uncultured Parasphingorhabdus sp. TaxID=2709694 RepID=UPI0030D83F34|tara:strand:+ start:42359 stop:43369 length:1011 start_codon:yes stop_codon:yes gene_type:complete
MRLLVSACAMAVLALSAGASEPAGVADSVILSDGLPRSLSDYGFFKDAAAWQPNERVVPYSLNTPLFTDYAEKYRFIYVPEGPQAKANGDGMFDFPVGSALIKSFGYEIDGKPRLLETRVLLHRADGWLALPYVWNEEQTEARLKVAGARIAVNFTDPSGKKRSINYGVPNKNQCKECHALSDAVVPIGPKARNLTHDGQLADFARLGLIDQEPKVEYRVPVWGETSAPLNDRARGYLDVNCAHCHNINGSASNSGLFLTYEEKMPVRFGINKRPVAAGRGSGNHDFDIAPGDPDGSIMIYRLNSLDPGISMPEVGRSIVHDEGVALLSQWIAEME